MASLVFNLRYSGPGIGVTLASIPLPSGSPVPYEPAGFGAANEVLYYGAGGFTSNVTNPVANNSKVAIAVNSADNGYVILISGASTNAVAFYGTITYPTSTPIVLP